MDHAFSGVIVRYCSPTSDSQAGKIPKNETDSNFTPLPIDGLNAEADTSLSNANQSTLTKKSITEKASQNNAEDHKYQDELHVNLWEVEEESFLDIGIKIHALKNLESIRVDLPWQVNREDISDLGTKLNSEKTLAAIFNEVVKYEGAADDNFAVVTFVNRFTHDEQPEKFTLARLTRYSFDVNYHQFSRNIPSTELKITIPESIRNREPIYIRFRVMSVPKQAYCSKFTQKDRALLSSSQETRIVDFRINVRRGIPEEILIGSASNAKYPDFKKIHCFITLDRCETCEFQNQGFVGCRSLMDEDIWDEYIKMKSTDGQMKRVKDYLGYQWSASENKKANKPVKDLLVLGRFSKTISDEYKILRFILLVVCMGMLSAITWDIVKAISTVSNTTNQEISIQIKSILTLIILMLIIIFELERRSIVRIGMAIKWLWRKTLKFIKNEFKLA